MPLTGSPPLVPPCAAVGVGWRHAHYAQVLTQRPELAFLEVHSENFFGDGGAALAVLAQGRALYPVSLHGVGLSLGSAVGLDERHLAALVRLVERIDPIRVSDHASFARAPLTRGLAPAPHPVHAADLLPVPWTHEALAVMVRHVQQVQERLHRPLAVENLSAYVQWAHADWSEPDFLTELARRSGCELLVDVNNLVVNALNAEGAPRLHGAPGHGQHAGDDPDSPAQRALVQRVQTTCAAWMDAIGADVRIAEIHVAGHTHTGDGVVDDHGHTVSAPVWAVHCHALARWGVDVPTLIEWDTDVPPWPVLLAEVARARACLPARMPGSV